MKASKKLTKKGQLAGIANGFNALTLAALFVGVVVITGAFVAELLEKKVDNFGPTECARHTGFTSYNRTSNLCYNASGTQALGGAPVNVTLNGLSGVDTLSEGTEDVADVSVITIILSLLFGVLAVFGVNYVRNK